MRHLSRTLLYLLLWIVPQASNAADSSLVDAPSESVLFLNAQNQLNDVPVQFTEGFADVDGARLHYVTAGSGRLVFFYHGFPSYWYMWKNQLNALAEDYQVVAVDGLGANLSSKPTDVNAYDISNLARQLHVFIQSIAKGQSYSLVGHDWGGALSWAYAQKYPDKLDKVIVLNAPPFNLFLEFLASDPEQQKSSIYVERLKSMSSEKELGLEDGHKMWGAAYSRLIERGMLSIAEGELFKHALASPGALTGGINWYRANVPSPDAIGETDFWPARYSSTPVNSLLIWGGEDRTFVHDMLQVMPKYAPRVQIEVLPGIGHWPSLEAPETVNKLIHSFIETED